MFAKRYALLLAIAFASACPTVRADDINWRTDYAAARDEAAAKKLPLVIEVTADFCSWCRKLESTTLSDPAVVNLVNKRFVAFKLQHEQYGWLSDALKISGYPTMLLAAPNGRIVHWQEGYVDANTFQRQLEQMLAPPSATASSQSALDSDLRPVSTNPR